MAGTPQYNGNIAEQVWKGGYDEYLRGYKYDYDKANRFKHASYGFKFENEWGPDNWDWTQRYDEEIGEYDRNGNIKQLTRWHGAFMKVDDLHYTNWDGNKLLNVQDWVSSNTPVGFKDGASVGYDDYQYDANGNMTFDHNKGIQSIAYNHLNLPQLITMEGGKGTIEYIYDATGNKLQKKVTDNPGNKITITKYAGAFVYSSSYAIGASPAADQLELISHDEGRIRPKPTIPTQPLSASNATYIYDYFLKDHLGNVRMVITSEQQQDLYAATMETANATKEEQLFSNITNTRITKPGGFDTDNNNAQVARLNGNLNTTGNTRVGPSLVIKVMAGDKISISTKAWYQGNTQAPPNGFAPISDEILSLLTNGIMAANGGKGGVFSQTDISSWLNPVVGDFLTTKQNPSYNALKPKAFLNWIIVDEEFKKVSSPNHMGVMQVQSGDPAATLVALQQMVVRRNGWLYVYVSNESPQDVFFDDIKVNHERGPVTEATDYYPFGTSITGLGTKAIAFGGSENKYKYNGKEEQKKEFSDGSGLEWYDYGARMYDGQIGRWHTSDPLVGKYVDWSPYNYAYNNTLKNIDPDGREIWIYYEEEKRNKKGEIQYKKNGQAKTVTRSVQYKDGKLFDSKGNEYAGDNKFLIDSKTALDYAQTKDADVYFGDGKSMVKELIDTKEKVFLKQGSGNTNYFTNSNTFVFNPSLGYKLFDQDGKETGRQSAAMQLLHEIGHAYRDLFYGENENKTKGMPTLEIMNHGAREEQFVTRFIETPAAQRLGEGTRSSYEQRKEKFTPISVTSREEQK